MPARLGELLVRENLISLQQLQQAQNAQKQEGGKLGYQQIPGWHGKCTPGEEFTAANCNQKLIGARYYNAGWGGNAGIDAQLPWEFNSPRDLGGHGTHTATTAGGNANTATTGAAAAFGPISGIAPRARIAAYKVCWETGSGGSCFSSDSVAAIDQAVADGVDVINFSISGSRTNFRDSVEIAFLFAADAGVFVAASAGASPRVLLSGLMLMMAVMTNIVSNNAAAVIGTPIAIGIAHQIGMPEEPFVLAVLFGANMSYATPIAYKTNLLVMSAGGYQFTDFMRVGVPLTLIMWLAFTWLLPWLYGL